MHCNKVPQLILKLCYKCTCINGIEMFCCMWHTCDSLCTKVHWYISALPIYAMLYEEASFFNKLDFII